MALRTHEPLVLARVDTDIPLAALSSGGTVHSGAEYCYGVHDDPPGVVGEHAKRSVIGPPFTLQANLTHGLVGSYPKENSRQKKILERVEETLREHGHAVKSMSVGEVYENNPNF